MTKKQENILNVALKLFAENGFNGTSTNRIAKEAGVSEGLIFKHFQNKQGLLDAIMTLAKEKFGTYLIAVQEIKSPQGKLEAIFELAFDIKEEDYHFWRLMYAIKWQATLYDDSMSKPFLELLTDIFKDLEKSNPESEATVLMILLEGIWTTVLLKQPKNLSEIKQAVIEKYING